MAATAQELVMGGRVGQWGYNAPRSRQGKKDNQNFEDIYLHIHIIYICTY